MTADKVPARRTAGIRWWAPWSARRRSGASAEPETTPSRELLLAGIREYHDRTAPLVRPIMAELAFQQTPQHLFITCVDSRVVPNIITASGPGDLFILRNVANLVPRHGTKVPDDSVAATVEYAVHVLGVKTITVCGHTHCGGMAALLAGGGEIEHLTALSSWLKHGNRSLARFLKSQEAGARDGVEPLARLVEINVMQQLDNLLTYPWLAEKVEQGDVELVGMLLELETATVKVLDPVTESFLTVPGRPQDVSNDLLEADHRP